MHNIDTDTTPLLVSTNDARLRLDISLGLFNRLVASGEIPVVWVGGCRRVRLADLHDFVERLPSGDRSPHPNNE